MRLIMCEECRKRYDCEKDDFCPRCGAFNQAVKTWTTDAQGNIRRVDGVNEANHAGSFVHSEVHKEKQIRQAKGMDWNRKTAPQRRQPPKPAPQGKFPQQSRPPVKTAGTISTVKGIFLIAGISLLLTLLLPLRMWLINFAL